MLRLQPPTLQIAQLPTLPQASPTISDVPEVTHRLKPSRLPQHEPGAQNMPASGLQSKVGKPPSPKAPPSTLSSRHTPAVVSQLPAHETQAVPGVPLPH